MASPNPSGGGEQSPIILESFRTPSTKTFHVPSEHLMGRNYLVYKLIFLLPTKRSYRTQGEKVAIVNTHPLSESYSSSP